MTMKTLVSAMMLSMTEVRAGVDDVDRALVALLVRRFGYMDAAARIKSARAAVRDEERKDQVLDNVAQTGAAAGLDPERLRVTWNESSEEHTSELQPLMRISYDLFCWEKTSRAQYARQC